MLRVRSIGYLAAIALALACGGRVSHDAPRAVSTSGGAGVASSSGGGAGMGGSAGSGAVAGVSGGAAEAGQAGVAGSAGAAAACLVPAQPTLCEEPQLGRYYLDVSSGHCTPYGLDCPSNENFFDSYIACVSACHPERLTCNKANDCQLGPIGCCGWSCTGALDLRSFVAINRSFETEQSNEACPNPHYCGPGDDPQDLLDFTCQNAIAVCDAGRCRVADLRELPVSDCQSDSDCALRVSSRCCPNACDQPLIAVSSEASLEKIVCVDSEACRCPAPVGYAPVCVQGRCTVEHASQ